MSFFCTFIDLLYLHYCTRSCVSTSGVNKWTWWWRWKPVNAYQRLMGLWFIIAKITIHEKPELSFYQNCSVTLKMLQIRFRLPRPSSQLPFPIPHLTPLQDCSWRFVLLHGLTDPVSRRKPINFDVVFNKVRHSCILLNIKAAHSKTIPKDMVLTISCMFIEA